MNAPYRNARPDEPAEEVWRDAQIAVVDDEPANVRLLENILSRAGYGNVAAMVDPVAFVDDYERIRPDLVLLDLMMPRLDGVDVLGRIRRLSPRGEFVPVLMLTADTGDDAMRRALSAGVDDFLTKPFDTVEVQLRIANLLRTRRLSLEVNAQKDLLEREVQRRTQDLQLFRDVLESVPDPVVIEDPDQSAVVFANTAITEHVGGRDDNPWANGQLGALAPDVVDGGRESAVVEDALRLDDGTERAVEILVQAVHRGDDRVLAGIARDVTDRVETQRSLHRALERERRAAEQLAETAQLKEAFLTAVSHEIRTPLSVVSGAAQTLLRRGGQLDPAISADLLERLVANAQRLEGMLVDLLDLNKLATGQVELRTETFRLDQALPSRVASIDLGDRPVDMHLPEIEIQADHAKLIQAIDALLTNVAKHTPPSTPLEITIDPGDPTQVRFADRGPGISDGLKRRIFEPFVHGPTSAAHSPGTGIGLTLARTLIEAHDGALRIEDTPGGGATFTIQIPTRRPTDH